MKDGFIWKGIHSSEKGFKIISLPNISTPEKREEKIIIPGRSGYLTSTDNSYEGEVKSVEFDYFGNNFDGIKQWLVGSGEVIFSNEPDRYYKARIMNKLDLTRVLERFHSGIVQFDCQPFGYDLQDETITITKNNSTIYNPGTYESQPYIKIFARGDVSLNINNEAIKFTNVTDYIELDSEIMECYKDSKNCSNKMYGEFPILKIGENKISWIGNVDKIKTTPRWRCL